MKIATLTLNPALDKSASANRLVPEQKIRCSNLQLDAGGGGINISKAIQRLGGQSTAIFPAGGANGDSLIKLLNNAGITVKTLKIDAETRENFSFLEKDTGLQYRFTLAGADMSLAQANDCLHLVEQVRPEWLAVSGSLPPGITPDFMENVAATAKKIGARLVLDTSGDALRAATEVGVYLLKPNLSELSTLAGVEELQMNHVDNAALDIINRGKCELVVVSLGAQGALLVTRDGFEHIPAPTVQKKSTVGAGDSMVAGLTWALAQGQKPVDAARLGVACGSAATMNAGTELFHLEDVNRLLDWIKTYGERYRIRDFQD